jgi:hypothetical protein
MSPSSIAVMPSNFPVNNSRSTTPFSRNNTPYINNTINQRDVNLLLTNNNNNNNNNNVWKTNTPILNTELNSTNYIPSVNIISIQT